MIDPVAKRGELIAAIFVYRALFRTGQDAALTSQRVGG
ncbi:hypothetical protein BH18ACT14_BH18ACT14_07180 [soil metagenome]